MRSTRLACLVGAAAAVGLHAGAGARPASFTIEQVMQAPFPTSLVVASRDKAVAWVFDTRGSRNVWVADGAHGMKARAVTSFTEDDGFNIGELTWSPDAKLIAFTRAQTLEEESGANVTSAPQGPTPREVWMVSAAGGDARKLGTGHSPAFSPDGTRLAFFDKETVLTVPAGGTAAPQPLLVDNGQIASVSFSPDGHRLAFVSIRRQHALIGVYDLSAQRIAWMSPSL